MKKLSAFIKEAGAASRLTDKYILAMLLIYPLFVGFWGYTRLTVSKSVFFAMLTLLWLMLTVAVSVKSRDAATSRAGNAPLRLILAYFALCCASALFSPYGASVLLGEGRFDGLLSLLLCAAVLLGTARFAEPKCAYLAASAASGVICCLIGIAQLFGFNPFDLFPSDYNFYDAGSRFSAIFIGTIGNADLFSAYLCLLLPISAAYYILAVKRPVWLLPVIAIFGFSLVECKVSAGLLAVCCTALIAPPLLITNGGRLCRALECFAVLCFAFCLASGFQGGRESGVIRVDFAPSVISAALLILAISSAIASLLLKKSDFPPKKLQVFFASLSCVIVLASLAAVYYIPPESGTLYELSQVLHGNFDDSFGSSRLLIWRETLALFSDRPLLGSGPGTLPLRVDIEFSRYVEETGQTLRSYVDNAHNEYLGILINTGLLSLLCHLAAQAASVILAAKHGGTAAKCLICGLVCYWIQAFFGLGLIIVSPFMWLCWGLLISALNNNEART